MAKFHYVASTIASFSHWASNFVYNTMGQAWSIMFFFHSLHFLCRSRLSNHLYAFDAKVGALSAQFFGLGGGCLHKVNICDVFCWIGYKTWVFLLLFLPTPRYASAGTSHGPVSVSVCLSVCHKSVFYQTAERFSWVLAAEICGFMCCRSLWPAVPGRAVKASVWTGDWPAAHLSTPLRPRTGGSFSLVMFLTLLHSMWSR